MKKTIMTLSTVLGLVLTTSAMANDAENMKQQDLQACDMKTQQLPEEIKAQKKQSCQCVVENTDYEALVEANKNGDHAKVQEIKGKAREVCKEA